MFIVLPELSVIREIHVMITFGSRWPLFILQPAVCQPVFISTVTKEQETHRVVGGVPALYLRFLTWGGAFRTVQAW